MSESYLYVSHVPAGLSAEGADGLLRVFPSLFNIGDEHSGWDFAAHAPAQAGADPAFVGAYRSIGSVHLGSLTLGWLGPDRDVVVLQASSRSLDGIHAALEAVGGDLLGLLTGLSHVAGSKRSLWMVDTSVVEGVGALRGELSDELLDRVGATWGDAEWAERLRAAGGRDRELVLRNHAVIRQLP